MIAITQPFATTLSQASDVNASNSTLYIGIGIALVAWLMFILYLSTRFKRCPSNRALVIWGKRGVNCYHGGGQFVWPIVQDYGYLDLDVLELSVTLQNIATEDNKLVRMSAVAEVAITTNPDLLPIAADSFLGRSREDIIKTAHDILRDEQREIIGTLTSNVITDDPKCVLSKLERKDSTALTKHGLELLSIKIDEYPSLVQANTLTVERSS